ncbi:hypothetical protein GCM10027575_62200 [Phytohabitans suffuscus]
MVALVEGGSRPRSVGTDPRVLRWADKLAGNGRSNRSLSTDVGPRRAGTAEQTGCGGAALTARRDGADVARAAKQPPTRTVVGSMLAGAIAADRGTDPPL